MRKKNKQILTPRYCIYCGAEFQGRMDKKFCSNKCRFKYHNIKKNLMLNGEIVLYKTLYKNYSILKDLVYIGISSIEIQKIQELGFKPSSCSEILLGKYSIKCRCYNIEYKMTGTKLYNIRFISSKQVQP